MEAFSAKVRRRFGCHPKATEKEEMNGKERTNERERERGHFTQQETPGKQAALRGSDNISAELVLYDYRQNKKKRKKREKKKTHRREELPPLHQSPLFAVGCARNSLLGTERVRDTEIYVLQI